jgi:nucleoside-diphosphate-sugar epimerase
MEIKSKVLVIGGTGYLGKRLVKASLGQGHETYVLYRPEIGVDIEKVQMLLSFKEQGAHLVQGSFNDQRSLVDAVKLVDVVICAVSGVHIRSHQILLQLKLVDAIKEAGNVKVDNLYESPVLSLMIVRSVLSFVISNFVPNFLLSLWLDHFSIIINVV